MFRVLADSDFVCDVHCTVFSFVSFYRSNRITTFWPEAKPFAKILGQIHKVKVMGWKMSDAKRPLPTRGHRVTLRKRLTSPAPGPVLSHLQRGHGQ